MTAGVAQATFSTVEVTELLDVSYRQLHHWVTKGWIPGLVPLGGGHGREWRWTLEQIGAARVVRDHLTASRELLANPTRCRPCPCGGGR